MSNGIIVSDDGARGKKAAGWLPAAKAAEQ